MRSNILRCVALAKTVLGLHVLAAVLALWIAAGADSTASAKERRVYGQGIFWQVTRPNIKPSHVLGTMHATDERVVDLPASVREALVRSDRLVLEVVFGPGLKSEMTQSMILTDGRTLSSIVGPRLFSRTEVQMSRYGLAGPQINGLRPWAVVLMLSLPPSEVLRQAQGHLMLDRTLQDYADRHGMPVYGLEEPSEQIAAFADMSETDQVALMDATITWNQRVDEIFETMLKIYLKGDLDRLHAMSRELSAGADTRLAKLYENRLIDGRNRHMADRSVPHLRAGGAFIAVGALHLSGETGLLHLLEKKGYRIKRVR